MCTKYTYKKDEAKVKLRDKIVVYGAVTRPASSPPYDHEIKNPGTTTSAASALTASGCVRGR
jgi:hypothetical protein